MRLRNKKTGEIKPAEAREDGIYLYDETTEQWYKYELDLLAKWWEYYEEPKEYWFISSSGKPHTFEGADDYFTPGRKEIGNYFSSREEAEKAVEKLKALAEAKEDGLKIKGYYYNHEDLVILADIGKCNKLTLDELFGKEID